MEQMLDGLVAAVESEGQGLDFSRASNFEIGRAHV